MSALHLPIKESAYFAGVGLGSANNIFDKDANLELTLIGKQEEETIKESLENLKVNFKSDLQILNSEFSIIKENKNYQSSPRSHG